MFLLAVNFLMYDCMVGGPRGFSLAGLDALFKSVTINYLIGEVKLLYCQLASISSIGEHSSFLACFKQSLRVS